jgi:hypothetical protein
MKTQILKRLTATLLAVVLLTTTMVMAKSKSQPSITPKAAFEKLKGLAGEWHGTEGEKDKGHPATVTYRTTSGGSAVVETLFPSSDHEMVTLYHLDGDKLVLTHYCMLANQPKMALTGKSSADELVFDFAGGSNVKPKIDMHMHSLRLRFENKDVIATEWDMFDAGKKVDSKKFFLTRKG